MNSLLRLIIALIVVLGIVAFMTTYTVRFTEKAVVTTFGDAKTVVDKPGLGFKWPYPIQSVIKYDTRLRFVEPRAETRQTADAKQIILSAYVTWRVDDPLKFFKTYGSTGARALDHFRAADLAVGGQLTAATTQVSRFKLTELLGVEGGGGKLVELENALLAAIRESGTGESLKAQGIEAVQVGVSSLRLPQSTTQQVFERMKATRTKLATAAASSGTAEATNIRSRATAEAKTIMEFAERRAQGIRSQGDIEAAKYYAEMKANTDLAAFQRNLEFIRSLVSRQATLVLSPATPGFGLFNLDTLDKMRTGEVPKAQDPVRAGAAAVEPAGAPIAGTPADKERP